MWRDTIICCKKSRYERCSGREGFGHEYPIPLWKGPVTIIMVMVPNVSDRPYHRATPSEIKPLQPGRGTARWRVPEAGMCGMPGP